MESRNAINCLQYGQVIANVQHSKSLKILKQKKSELTQPGASAESSKRMA